jgi:hypothetical protein
MAVATENGQLPLLKFSSRKMKAMTLCYQVRNASVPGWPLQLAEACYRDHLGSSLPGAGIITSWTTLS